MGMDRFSAERLKQLYTANVRLMRGELLSLTAEPLTVRPPSEALPVWYWVPDEEPEGRGEVERRLLTRRQDIVDFLQIHWQVLRAFEWMDGTGTTSQSILFGGASDALVKALVAYEDLVCRHRGKREHDIAEPFLHYPFRNPHNPEDSLEFCNRVLALSELRSVLRRREYERHIEGFGVDSCPLEMPYDEAKPIPHVSDSSYRGRLEFVRHDLEREFKFGS